MGRSRLAVLSILILTSIYYTPSNHFRLPLPVYPLSQVFVIPPVPSVLLESLPSSRAPLLHGHYAASQLTTCPSATLSSSTVFLVWPVIRLPCSAIFLGGTRRASPVARYVLVTVLSLPPRRSGMSPRSARDMSCCLRPERGGSASGSKFCFEATCGFTFVTAR